MFAFDTKNHNQSYFLLLQMGSSVWFYPFILVLLVILPHHQLVVYSMPSSPPYNHSCPHDQSLALLQFNQMFTIDSSIASYSCESSGQPKTMSWKRNTDCCTWDGVTCDGLTGHVIELDLSCGYLVGYIPSNTTTLFHLSHLNRLNLAFNNFYPSRISHQFLSQFATTLTHLNLSDSAFSGQISSEISHMSKLVSLDLSYNFESQLGSHNFRMLLQNLTQLKQLSLSEINISSTVPLNFSSSLTSLDLSETALYGKLPDSIGYWKSLNYLDLSGTSLRGELPDSIGYLKSLNRLRLAACEFSGSIPRSLGNLTQLADLDIRGNDFSGQIPSLLSNPKRPAFLDFSHNNFTEISHNPLTGPLPSNIVGFPRLKALDFSYNSFSGTIPSWLFALPSLTTLFLNSNRFTGKIPEIQSKSLETIDLRDNNLHGPIPQSSSKLVNLTDLNFGHNAFSGTIPSWLFALPSLTTLDLYSNRFTGKIPEIQSKSLVSIGLSGNNLHGPIPQSFSKLVNLTYLYFDNNSFNGTIPSLLFALPSLTTLVLYSNRFTGKIPEIQSKSLLTIDLGDNNLNGPIPQSFSKLVNLTYLILRLSGNNFSDTIELGMFSNLTNLKIFNISCNGLSVITTNTKINVTFPQLRYLRLASCKMKEFPHLFKDSPNLQIVDLSDNQIHGQLSNWPLSMWSDPLQELNLRSNLLQGPLPSSICNFSSLNVLDLSNNIFSGTIPQCLGNFNYNLWVLDLRNNGFRGTIPATLGAKGNSLQTLNLHGNQLEGTLPRSLANCKQLDVLDLGNNQINDTFPHWLETLPRLQVLVLRYNRFHGPIKNTAKTKLPFPNLRIIDLSNNQFTGFLPSKYFRYFKAMMNVSETELEQKYITTENYSDYHDEVTVTMKGLEFHMVRILIIFTTIDLSSNKFEGEIPNFIGNLNSLRVLNLSHNNLAGHVPSTLGNISVLESLDLSSNQLVGEIPQQLTFLTFLAVLNLSKNHLVGPIPHGKQFDTFENDSYIGNSALCGPPLSKQCGDDETPQSPAFQQKEVSNFASGFTWKVVVMGYGCGTIFGLVMGLLMFLTGKPKWFTEIVGNGQHTKIKRPMKSGVLYFFLFPFLISEDKTRCPQERRRFS